MSNAYTFWWETQLEYYDLEERGGDSVFLSSVSGGVRRIKLFQTGVCFWHSCISCCSLSPFTLYAAP